MKRISGIVPPIPTPLNNDETVDEKKLREMIKFCKGNEFDGVFVCGTNGEGMALTQKERIRAFEISLNEADGTIPVLGGCMDTSTQRVIEAINEFECLGGKYAVVTAPIYYVHKSEDEMVNHFKKISESVNIDFFIYNIPAFVGYSIPRNVVLKVSEYKHIIGYKDSSGDIDNFIKYIDYFKNCDFMLFQGKATQCALSLALGADGVIPNVSTVVPEVMNNIVKYSNEKNLDRALKYQKLMNELLSTLFATSNTLSACKYAHTERGLMSEQMCAPNNLMSDAEKEKIHEVLMYIDQEKVKIQ